MSNKKRVPIATIKLAPGEAGYYDEYSRIYLSSSRPDAVIYSGTNCTQIKRSIKSGRLRLVSGGFDKPVTQEEVFKEEAPVVQEVVEQKTEEAEVKPVEEENKESAPVEVIVNVEPEQVEDKIEEQEQQPVEEVVVAKKSRRRSRKQEEVAETTFEEVPVIEENV